MLHAFLTASILSPETIIEKGGLLLVAAIIFAESGLLIGFFLPGDSLLFITGFLTNTSTNLPVHVNYPLPVVLIVLVVAAVLGDQVGYLFGRRVGPALFRRPDSKLFKQENVEKAQAFFDRHGPKTIVLARFVPIVRTFAPIVAGVGRMRYRQFVSYNLAGGTAWAAGVTTLGYFLGKISVIRHNIELAALAIVFVSLVPVLLEVKKHRAARATSPHA